MKGMVLKLFFRRHKSNGVIRDKQQADEFIHNLGTFLIKAKEESNNEDKHY